MRRAAGAVRRCKLKAWPFPGRVALRERASGATERGRHCMCSITGRYLGTARVARRSWQYRCARAAGIRRVRCRCVPDPACAISRVMPHSTGMDLREADQSRCAVDALSDDQRQCALLDRDGAGGRRLGAGGGIGAVRRKRYPRTQPRREIPGHARGRLSRLPVVAHRDRASC